jgi:hypothetical protein
MCFVHSIPARYIRYLLNIRTGLLLRKKFPTSDQTAACCGKFGCCCIGLASVRHYCFPTTSSSAPFSLQVATHGQRGRAANGYELWSPLRPLPRNCVTVLCVQGLSHTLLLAGKFGGRSNTKGKGGPSRQTTPTSTIATTIGSADAVKKVKPDVIEVKYRHTEE